MVREFPELDVVLEFGWMDTAAPPLVGTRDTEWLDDGRMEEIGRFLDRAFLTATPDLSSLVCRDGLAAG